MNNIKQYFLHGVPKYTLQLIIYDMEYTYAESISIAQQLTI